MLVLVSGATKYLRKAREQQLPGHEHLGVLLDPFGWADVDRIDDSGVQWAADNGCFGGLNEEAYLRMVARIVEKPRRGLMWVTVPDCVGDHGRTIELWHCWQPMLVQAGWASRAAEPGKAPQSLPLAFVCQDGVRLSTVPWSQCQAVFLGGTDAWKLSPACREMAAEARARGKLVHLGRVNGGRRARLAVDMGCDSVDGSSLSRFSRDKLPGVIGAVDAAHRQGRMGW